MSRTTKPDSGESSRVSPTATAQQSESANIWRMLEADQGFVEGMNKAAAEKASGKFGLFRHVAKRPTR